MSELDDKSRAQLERFLDSGETLLFARSIWGEWADLRLEDPLIALAPSLYVVGVTSERVIAAVQRAMGRPKKLKLDLPRDQVVVIPTPCLGGSRGRGYVGDQAGLILPLDGKGAGEHERALFLKTSSLGRSARGPRRRCSEAVDGLTQALVRSDRERANLPASCRHHLPSVPHRPRSRTSPPAGSRVFWRRTRSSSTRGRSARTRDSRLPVVRSCAGAPKSLAVGLSDRRLIAAPLGRLQRGGLVVDRPRAEVSVTAARVRFGSYAEGEGFVLGTGESSGASEVIYWLRLAMLRENEWQYEETSDAVEELARHLGAPSGGAVTREPEPPAPPST